MPRPTRDERWKILETARQEAEEALFAFHSHLQDKGTVWGNIDILWFSDASDEKMIAIDWLLDNGFSRNFFFHNDRWRLLEEAFRAYRREDESWKSEWRRLARGALFIAIQEIPDDLDFSEMPRYIRNEGRKAMERTLLDGRTLDAKPDLPMPEEDTAAYRRLEKRLAVELLEGIMTIQQALERLDDSEREALRASLETDGDAKLAARDGVTEAAIRMRRMRARKKLEEPI